MSESLRGSRLGYLSYESDVHVMPAERRTTVVPFSVEAEEIPYDWTCRCGRLATRPDVDAPEAKPERHQRTHWDMLLERRTIADLESLLAERLELLHAGEGRPLRRSA
jgi:hypothetical protein